MHGYRTKPSVHLRCMQMSWRASALARPGRKCSKHHELVRSRVPGRGVLHAQQNKLARACPNSRGYCNNPTLVWTKCAKPGYTESEMRRRFDGGLSERDWVRNAQRRSLHGRESMRGRAPYAVFALRSLAGRSSGHSGTLSERRGAQSLYQDSPSVKVYVATWRARARSILIRMYLRRR